ncbi:MAG: hypothetical protein ACRC7N_13270, partial [Clostridium sp.]
MAMTNRFSNNTMQGSIQLIGNTLGLSKALNSLAPGTYGGIGVFITTLPSSQVPGWNPYTTTLPSKAFSSAVLNIPLPNTIVYAELIWSATRTVPGSTIAVGTNGFLIGPDNNMYTLSNNVINVPSQDVSDGGQSATAYVFSSNVTTIVSALGNGIYTFGSIPATLSPTANFAQYSGWGLYVAYESPKERVQAVNLYTGTNVTNDGPYGVTVNYPGLPAKLFISAMGMNGDVNKQDAFFDRVAGTVNGPWIEGPNNPPNNFYCSQINYPGDTINTFGPFGTVNHIAPLSLPVVGGRQGTDISTVNMNNLVKVPRATLAMDLGASADTVLIVGSGYTSNLSQPIILLNKSANKNPISVGDTVIFTTTVGNYIAPTISTVFIDTLPSEVSFIPNSVILNGISSPGLNPTTGINLGSLGINVIRTITFSVLVNSTSSNLKLYNISTTNSTFTVNGIVFSGTEDSNLITLDYTPASSTKFTDKYYAKLGDVINYSINITNYNTLDCTNTIFTDTLPNGVNYIPNTFKINDSSFNGDPTAGINIGTIPGLSTFTLTFSAIINTIPNNNNIVNRGVFNYTTGTIPSVLISNSVVTTISSANLSIIKNTNKLYATTGDTIAYTITLSNLGNSTAFSVSIVDTIPLGASFVSNSFMEDLTSSSKNPAPPLGASIGNIVPNQIKTISFTILVNSVVTNPLNNSAISNYSYIFTPTIINSEAIISNVVSTTINTVNLSNFIKMVDLNYATPNQTLTYTITVSNTGTTDAFNA